MDDIFSILIYIIVIISFLSSLFKKKNPQTPPEQNRREHETEIPERITVNQTGVDTEEYDILREIENMFKTEAEKERDQSRKQTKIEESARPIERTVPSEKVSYEDFISGIESPVPEKIRDYSEQTKTKSEHRYSDYTRKVKKVDKKTEETARKFQEMLERKSSGGNDLRDNILAKIRNPETFREYILVSEILSRPKALRR
jgi:hypothetical protein